MQMDRKGCRAGTEFSGRGVSQWAALSAQIAGAAAKRHSEEFDAGVSFPE
jgi:hypothetical protein